MLNIEFHVQLNMKCRNLVKNICVHTHCLEWTNCFEREINVCMFDNFKSRCSESNSLNQKENTSIDILERSRTDCQSLIYSVALLLYPKLEYIVKVYTRTDIPTLQIEYSGVSSWRVSLCLCFYALRKLENSLLCNFFMNKVLPTLLNLQGSLMFDLSGDRVKW